VTQFHHRKLPDYSTLLSGHTPPDEVGFPSSQLQIWYNNTGESWVGDGERPHKHLHSDECFIVLRGSLVVEVDGRRYTIGPREFCCFPAGQYHAVVNVHPPVETLMIRAPSVADKICQAKEEAELPMTSNYTTHLQQLFDIQQTIRDIHPSLGKLFPVAIFSDDQFFIYDLDPTGQEYIFVRQVETPMPVPPQVRAAFPLESYGERMVCVVTGDVFDELAGYVTIFHEFVHCQQFEGGEQHVKQSLDIARQAQVANDFMWELNHPFPYMAPDFIQAYQSVLEVQTQAEIMPARRQLQEILSANDYEYMVWQEWKEGLARFIENRIKVRLGLPENQGGKEQPFSRVTFYAGGANFIAALDKAEPALISDIERLFERMFQEHRS